MELANLVNPWILFFTCTHISMIPTNYPLLGSESRKIILLREKAYQSFKGNAQCIYYLENMDMSAVLLRLGYRCTLETNITGYFFSCGGDYST